LCTPGLNKDKEISQKILLIKKNPQLIYRFYKNYRSVFNRNPVVNRIQGLEIPDQSLKK
jgi:hypothetical protein